jgi:hypothetical protein
MQGQLPPTQPQIQYVRVERPPMNWKLIGGVCKFAGVALIGGGILYLAADFSTYFTALQSGSGNLTYTTVTANWENGIVGALEIVGIGTIIAGLGSLFKGAHRGP